MFLLSLYIKIDKHSSLSQRYIKVPAARNACWQNGFKSCRVEWTMDEKNCGAFSTQWDKNGGKCGVCGDPYHLQEQKYVYPGSHATGTLTQTYVEGQTIELEVSSKFSCFCTVISPLTPPNYCVTELRRFCALLKHN